MPGSDLSPGPEQELSAAEPRYLQRAQRVPTTLVQCWFSVFYSPLGITPDLEFGYV